MSIITDVLLWSLVAAMAGWVFYVTPKLVRPALMDGAGDFLRLVPRILVAVLGSGFIAAAMPEAVINVYIGPQSGWGGVTFGAIAGAIAPGGPVVGFSIAAAAMKGGAGHPQVVAFVVAWTLFAVQRIVLWEMPFMSLRFILLRGIVSLPLPFLAAAAVMFGGRP